VPCPANGHGVSGPSQHGRRCKGGRPPAIDRCNIASVARRLAGGIALAALSGGALAAGISAHGVKSCAGFERQVVIAGGTDADHAAACEGFARAVAFFSKLGYKTDRVVTIQFSDSVVLPVKDANDHETFIGGTRVVGMFEATVQRVTMTSLASPWVRTKRYFRLKYDRELLVSVLAHESAHALSKSFYRYKVSPSVHAQEEYIAYAAQLSIMAARKLRQLLANYPAEQRTFSHESSINDLVHATAPHAFGVRSFTHFTGPDGGKAFLERIYSGEFRPINFADLP
jgi:hypothetical protein